MRTIHLGISYLLGCLVLALPAACSDSNTTENEAAGGEPASSGDGGGAPEGQAGGEAQPGGGSSSAGSSGNGPLGEGGDVASGGVSNPGNEGGSGPSGAHAKLCDDLLQLKQDKAEELGCTGTGIAGERDAWRRLCELGEPCSAELQAHYQCQKVSNSWSCDTSDGHPQTNADCSSDAFFACLGPVVHEQDPFGCAATAAAHDAAADELGCDHNVALENTCNQLYLRDLCTSEWEALVACLDAGEVADTFECDEENQLHTQSGVCEDERDAYDTCLPD